MTLEGTQLRVFRLCFHQRVSQCLWFIQKCVRLWVWFNVTKKLSSSWIVLRNFCAFVMWHSWHISAQRYVLRAKSYAFSRFLPKKIIQSLTHWVSLRVRSWSETFILVIGVNRRINRNHASGIRLHCSIILWLGSQARSPPLQWKANPQDKKRLI
jgi:hypothetical protein